MLRIGLLLHKGGPIRLGSRGGRLAILSSSSRSYAAAVPPPPSPSSDAATSPPPPPTPIKVKKDETGFEKALREAKEDDSKLKSSAAAAASLSSSSTLSPTVTTSTTTTTSNNSQALDASTISGEVVPSTANPTTPTPTVATPTSTALTKPKKSLWERVKEEAVHYWHGTKLLAAETKISSRLLLKVLKGGQLSRREYRQLRRTTGDLLRLIPFVVILLVPFLEFALPVLLRFFPNMLPSTFESKFQEEEKKKNLFKVRIQMARFLQETVGEVALSGTAKADATKEFNDFFSRCRISGNLAPTEDIVRISRNLEDELTLNNLSRPQLVSIARFMNLNAFGTDSFLRSLIESQLRELKQDDQMIQKDGVDALTIGELQAACSARGIHTIGASPARMRSELAQWLELHLVHKIPSSLLLLSLAFQTTSRIGGDALDISKAEALQATLSSLPHQVVNEAHLKISEQEGVATYKQKLDVLKEQEELIADELEQDAAQEAAKREKAEEEILKKQEIAAAEALASHVENPHIELEAQESVAAPAVSEHSSSPFVNSDAVAQTVSAVNQDSTTSVQASSSTPPPVEDNESDLSHDEKKQLVEAIKTLSADSAIKDVKETLSELKEDRQEFIEDVQEFKEFTKKDTPKSSDRLGSTVDRMIQSLEKELEAYDKEIGSKLNLVKPNMEGQISILELEETLKVIRSHPNDERIGKIIAKLDDDKDGLVAMHQILSLHDEKLQKDGHGEIKKKEAPAPLATSASPAAQPTPKENESPSASG